MCTLKWSFVGGMLGFALWSQAVAQDGEFTPLRQPASVDRVGFAPEGYVSLAPQPDSGVAALAPTAAAKDEKKEEKKDEEEKPEEPKAWEFSQHSFLAPWLECHNIDIRGWADMGYTYNPDNPNNKFNSGIGYNDRSNELDLNQLYWIFERVTKTDECKPWDIGGRLDLLYGTDRRYASAFGLDDEWNAGSRFYGLIMPQAYVDVAYDKWVFRVGHFLAPVGYESVMAPENFFYSHTYSFLYGQPTTLSGEQSIYKLNDQWSFNSGLDTGWNNWDTQDGGKVQLLCGFNWQSKDQESDVKRSLACEVFSGDQADDRNRSLLNVVFNQQLGKKWRYACEINLAYDGAGVKIPGGFTHADWEGVANYLFYDINDNWSFGMRYEYFADPQGAVVQQVGPPTVGPVPSHYDAFSCGFNWKPTLLTGKPSKNIVFRTEIRADHSTAKVFEVVGGVGTTQDEFLWANDLIVRF